MTIKMLGILASTALLAAITAQLGRSLKQGRAPSLFRIGHTPVGPELTRERSPWLFGLSIVTMMGVWLVVAAALLKVLLFPE